MFIKARNFKFISAAVFVLLGFAVLMLMQPSKEAGAQGPPGMMGPMPATVALTELDDVRVWKEFPGRLVAVESAEIRPQVSGRITEIYFEDGQHVEKDDPLFVIDPRPYEAAVAQAEAALKAAQSNFSRANKDFKRSEELIKVDAISKSTFDERRSQKDFTWAEIKGAKATIEQAQIDLDHAHVKAPISGRVSRAEITVGNLVEAGPNAPIVTTIVADEEIYADFEVDEQTYLSNIREQARNKEQESKIPVQVVLRGDGENVIDGVIHTFDNRINPASGTIRARAILKNDDGALLPGMFAKVRLGSAEQQRNILISQKAIGTDQDRKFVYVVGDDNMTQYRQVETGDRVGENRVILSGLEEGERVITEGIVKIRPGMPVKPTLQERLVEEKTMPVPEVEEEPQIIPDQVPESEVPEENTEPQ